MPEFTKNAKFIENCRFWICVQIKWLYIYAVWTMGDLHQEKGAQKKSNQIKGSPSQTDIRHPDKM